MAENTVSFSDLALDKFSGNDPDQDAKSFLLTVENKINFSLGSRPADNAERARYLFRKKALFSSLLRGPAAEWYADSITDAATWDQIRTAFIDRFSDDRDKYRHRITAENCVRGNEELIKNFYHRVKSAVDKGWPLDPNGTDAERDNQQNQRNAKYIEFTVRGLRPTGLKRKAHEYLIEHPNATWDAFQTHITSKDVIYTISSELVPNATSDQNTKLHSLEQQIKELTALFKEQQVNQVTQPNSRPANPDNKSRQNMTRFCSYCRRNGHTLMYCRTKAYDDEIKRQQTRNNQERRTVFTHDYNKRRGPNFGSQNNQNFNQQPRYGNQNKQTPYRQNGFNPDRNRNPNSDRQFQQNRSSNSWNNRLNQRQQTQYNFSARPENSDTQYNRNFLQSNNLPTPNSVQFIDDYDANMISDISLCNHVGQKTSHSFRFEDSYDSLCYKFYLQDIEEQNLRLKTERIEPPVETYTEDIKPLIETRCRINCPEYESTDFTSILSTPTLNIERHSKNEESLEDSFDTEERTDEFHPEEKDFSYSHTDVPIPFNTPHTEIMSKPLEEEPIEENLHFHFELITEPSDPTEETKFNGDTFAEEHFNDTEMKNTDQRRQTNPTSLFDKRESALNYAVDCPDTPNHDKLQRENEFIQILSPTYQRCRQITSKAHEHRNRYKLGRPISTGQKVFLENHAQDLTRSQKLKQLRVGPFTVTKQITNTTYEIREDANPDNVKTTHRNHLIEYFPKEERLPPLITNYAVISKDSDFYKHLVNSQIEQYNSGKKKHSLDVMPFVITPIQSNSEMQQKENIEFSPRADSGIHSPASSMQQSPRSKKSSPYENRALFPLPEFQSQNLPMTPIPRQPHDLQNPIRDSQPSNSNTPQNSTTATDKGKIAHFATKVKEKYKRNDPNSSLRKQERKGYKD